MAIYDIDSIMESNKVYDIETPAINESGGAHQKYAKMLAKQDRDLKNKIKRAEYIGSGSKYQKYLIDKCEGRRYQLADKADKYIDNGVLKTFPSYSVPTKEYISKDPGRSRKYISSFRKAKENFAKDFGGPGGEDKLAEKQRRHDEIAAKKKAIKETCLNILTVIDEL